MVHASGTLLLTTFKMGLLSNSQLGHPCFVLQHSTPPAAKYGQKQGKNPCLLGDTHCCFIEAFPAWGRIAVLFSTLKCARIAMMLTEQGVKVNKMNASLGGTSRGHRLAAQSLWLFSSQPLYVNKSTYSPMRSYVGSGLACCAS